MSLIWSINLICKHKQQQNMSLVLSFLHYKFYFVSRGSIRRHSDSGYDVSYDLMDMIIVFD
jgi:hypothetical protein